MNGMQWCEQKVGGVMVQVQQCYAWVIVHLGEKRLDDKLFYKGYTTQNIDDGYEEQGSWLNQVVPGIPDSTVWSISSVQTFECFPDC